MAEAAHIVHQIAGRVRLRVPGRKADGAFFDRLSSALAGLPDVREVSVNPATAGVLVHHAGEWSALILRMHEGDLLEVSAAPAAAGSPLQTVSDELTSLDGLLRGATEGRWGLGSLAFYGLLGGAVVQVAKGHYLPAASSLVYHAMKVLGEVVEHERAATRARFDGVG